MCCALSSGALAQRWEIGGLAGTANYFGDLNPLFSFRRPGPSASFLVRRNYDGRMCWRANLSYANIGASDARSSSAVVRARNLSFQSNVVELSTAAEFNFISFHSQNVYNREDEKFTPFLSAGFGILYHNPKAKYQDQWYALQPLGTEGQAPGNEYSLVQFAFIVGGGFKWELSQNWSLNLDISHRLVRTDYLDDVSGIYADKRIIEGHNGSLAAALSDRSVEVRETAIGIPGHQRGDSKARDSYMTIQIGFIYNFRELNCPAY